MLKLNLCSRKRKLNKHNITYSQKLLDHVKKLAQMYLKPLQKLQFKKQQKQLLILLVIKLLIKLQKLYKTYCRILQRQLKVKEKYQKKDVVLQKKDRKLLVN